LEWNPLITTIQKGWIQSIDIETQVEEVMENIEKKKQYQQIRPIQRNLKPPARPKFSLDQSYVTLPDLSVAIYKSNVLAPQTTFKARICHYDKGPNLFYIQVQTNDEALQKMMGELQAVDLHSLNTVPKNIGTAVLARYRKKVYRVAIAKVIEETQQNNEILIPCLFVDYGFTSSLRFDNLFYIPERYLQHSTFAIPFSLSGFKKVEMKTTNIVEISFYFRQITENRLLKLKCEAFNGE
jgi:hypothetical protein